MTKDIPDSPLTDLSFRELLDHVHDAVFLVDAGDGTVLEVNGSASGLFGIDREELVGQSVASLAAPADAPRIREQFAATELPDRFQETHVYERADGSSFVGEVTASRVEVDGRPCLLGFLRDVTDRGAMERLYLELIRQSPAGMAVLDLDGRILDANAAAADLLGFDEPEALEGTSITDLYADLSRRDELREQLEEEGQVRNFEAELRRRNGETVWLLMNIIRRFEPGYEGEVLLETWVDLTERRRLEEELEQQALHDPLTGLPNRRALYERAGQILSMCERQERKAALVYMDLVGFKRVNEQLGHRAGDAALREVATRLRETVRDADVACRIGGDEFVVLATLVTDEEDAARVARRVVSSLDEPVVVEAEEIHLQPAAGVSVYPHDGTDVDTLLDRADRSLWGPERKKAPGVRLYRAEMEAEVPEVLRLRDDLERALQRGREEFELHYQPVVSSATQETVGAEALVRWRHPETGLVPAGDFIPVAEASGLIGRIDRMVIVEAARQIGRWEGNEGAPEWVAVNLSAQTLGDPEFAGWLENRLRELPDLDPRKMVVEITEHAAMRQEEIAGRLLRILERQFGLAIAIDDFGTGYASLLYLRRFPSDYLKIDMDFVHGLGEEEEDEKVVRAIIALGQEFGAELIAEGVETEAQREWLVEAGCQNLQGYLCGRPAPPDELTAMGPAA